ncbi:unnamed protein product [Lactuca virosa]|uniref:Uncharacterized protein n=1 Tax=Lactuca virosa TaxID=75947 RepID=A0AAU9N0N8_9ASTR|nr:unnamed protein product [Lactuca virosa]
MAPAIDNWWLCGCDAMPAPIIVPLRCPLLARGVTVVVWVLWGLTIAGRRGEAVCTAVVMGFNSESGGTVTGAYGSGPLGAGVALRFGLGFPINGGAPEIGVWLPGNRAAGVSSIPKGPIGRMGLCGCSYGSPVAFSAMRGCGR